MQVDLAHDSPPWPPLKHVIPSEPVEAKVETQSVRLLVSNLLRSFEHLLHLRVQRRVIRVAPVTRDDCFTIRKAHWTIETISKLEDS